MGRQSPLQLKCHCVLQTGATDVFRCLNGVDVVSLQPCTRKGAIFSLVHLQPETSGSAARQNLWSNLVFSAWFWATLAVLETPTVQPAPHSSSSVQFLSLLSYRCLIVMAFLNQENSPASYRDPTKNMLATGPTSLDSNLLCSVLLAFLLSVFVALCSKSGPDFSHCLSYILSGKLETPPFELWCH